MKTIFNIILIFSVSMVHAQSHILNYSQVDSIVDYGRGKGVVVNDLGEYYVTGESMLTSLYNGQPLNVISGNKDDGIILSKFSENGNILWSVFEQNTGSSSINRVNSISLDNQENVIIGGFYESNLSFEDQSINSAFGSSENPFVAKFQPDGTLVWLRRIHTPGLTSMGRITSVSTDGLGNIYFGGSFGGTMTFGGDTIQNWGYGDNFWGKMDDAGNVLWVRAAGSELIERGVSIKADSAGSIYVTGYVASQPVPNYVGASLNIQGGGFITKYSTDGQMLWLRSTEKGRLLTGPVINERTINEKNGKVIVTGYMIPENDTIQIAGLQLVSPLSSPSEKIRYAMMLDENGNGIWLTEVLKFHQSSTPAIDFKDNGDVMVLMLGSGGFAPHLNTDINLGGLSSTMFFTLNGLTGSVINYFYPLQPNYNDGYGVASMFIKNDTIVTTGSYIPDGATITSLFIGKYFPSALSINENNLSQYKWLMYPNPSEGIVFLQPAIDQVSRIKNIDVFDVSGKLVYSQSPNFVNNENIRLDLSHLRTGVYFIRVRTEQDSFSRKLIIKK